MSETISVHNMFSSDPRFELGILQACIEHVNNLSSYCGLVDAKIRASDKDLPVIIILTKMKSLVKMYRNKNLPAYKSGLKVKRQ